MKTSYMNRHITNAIKGIALILMFVHHFFTFPDWYVEGIEYPELAAFARYFCSPTKICVCIFAFLTGYFYFFSKQKTYRYSLRKITDVLVTYWIVYIPLLILAVVLGCYQFSPSDFLLELFALKRPVMTFCWYVYFYYIAMLLMPLIAKLSTDSLSGDIFLLIVLPVMLFGAVRSAIEVELGWMPDVVIEIINSMQQTFPIMVFGFLFGKYTLFETVLDKIGDRFRGKRPPVILWLLMAMCAFLAKAVWHQFTLGSIHAAGIWSDVTFSVDILYAPLFLYGTSNLLSLLKKDGWVMKILGCIGKQSLFMWFLHCVFFNICEQYTQPILYLPQNPILVLIFGLILCYLAAIGLDPLRKWVLEKKNRYF